MLLLLKIPDELGFCYSIQQPHGIYPFFTSNCPFQVTVPVEEKICNFQGFDLKEWGDGNATALAAENLQ